MMLKKPGIYCQEREKEKREGEKQKDLLVAHWLWHSTEKSSESRENWRNEDYEAGIPTRLQLAQQNRPLLQATENSLFWKLVSGHRAAEGQRGQSNLPRSLRQVPGQHESHAPGEPIAYFLGQNSGVRILGKK